jgi:hypothetical protein
MRRIRCAVLISVLSAAACGDGKVTTADCEKMVDHVLELMGPSEENAKFRERALQECSDAAKEGEITKADLDCIIKATSLEATRPCEEAIRRRQREKRRGEDLS